MPLDTPVARPLATWGARSRRLLQVTGAFVRMSARATFSYPLGFALFLLAQVTSILTFYFLAHFVAHSGAIGPSYLAFATVGLGAGQLTAAGIIGLSSELDAAIQQGRMEMLLIEPVSWRLLPLALVIWQAAYRGLTAALLVVIAAGLGARFVIPDPSIVVLLSVLGVVSGVAIGVLAASLRILAKRSDPIATLFTLAGTLLSGGLVPLNVFPVGLRVVAWFLPSTYLIAGLRKAMLPGAGGIYGPGPLGATLLLVAFVVVLLPLAVWLFGRALDVGRRYGVLAGY